MPEQPVDWTSVKPNATGPRHYQALDLGPVAWRCPSCGEENQSPLAAGCPHCGSGQPGKHVGVDPVVRPEDRRRQLAQPARPARPIATSTPIYDAYLAWKEERQLPPMPEATDRWLYDAFRGGWEANTSHNQHEVLTLDLPAPTPVAPAAPLAELTPPAAVEEEPAQNDRAGSFPGTARERTLLAALTFFRNQVVPEAAEEVGSGEWMSVAEIDQWIADLTEALSERTDTNDTGTEYVAGTGTP